MKLFVINDRDKVDESNEIQFVVINDTKELRDMQAFHLFMSRGLIMVQKYYAIKRKIRAH